MKTLNLKTMEQSLKNYDSTTEIVVEKSQFDEEYHFSYAGKWCGCSLCSARRRVANVKKAQRTLNRIYIAMILFGVFISTVGVGLFFLAVSMELYTIACIGLMATVPTFVAGEFALFAAEADRYENYIANNSK